MKKNVLKIALILGLPLMFAACLNDDYTPPDYNAILLSNIGYVDKTQLALDKQIIDDSLARPNWNIADFEIDAHGVRYIIDSLGTGPKPKLESVIVVKYKAILLTNGLDGAAFDEGDDLTINLYNLIIGWQTALPNIPEGSKARLFIPSGYAYGPVDIKDEHNDIVIPKNSNLIFEIQLLDVQ